MGLFETAGHRITLSLNGRQTRIGSFPVGIEPRGFQRLARRNVRSSLVKNLVASLGGRDLVIGVDRLDYSKGLIQRLDAFDIFLAKHSEWHRQGDISADHAEEPLGDPGICRTG